MSIPTEEQDRRNAAEALRKELWCLLYGHVSEVSRDVFRRDKPEAIEAARELLDRIERTNEWAKE